MARFFNSKINVILLIAFGCIALHPSETAAETSGSKYLPKVRFSNLTVDRNNNIIGGYFDIFYFNSEFPIDSRVFIKSGFELGRYDSVTRTYLPFNTWFNEGRQEMTQWEEFGWYVRIPVSVYYQKGWYKTLAIDMIFDYLSASKNKQENDITEVPSRFYARGILPDFKDCKNYDSTATRSCDVEVQMVTGF